MLTPRPRLALLLLATLGCAPAPSKPPNVLLISIDTLRADHLGCYGYPRETSPFLDSLAARGVRFERAFVQASWTLPSHMSLMTSCYPLTHRVENADRSLPAAIATLAESFAAAGYHTEGFVSWVYLKASYGFGRGFAAYHELLPPPGQDDPSTHASIKADAFVDQVLERIGGWQRPAEQPWLLFLHLFDPHQSYEPPLEVARRFDPELTSVEAGSYSFLNRYILGLHREDPPAIPPADLKRALALYDGEIRFTDDALQRLFDALDRQGLLDETVIVVTSDHGEEFAEHGSMEGHQWTLYDEVLHVPLIVVLPGGAHAGQVVAPLVQSIDVAPTLLALAGLERPPSFEGRSLLPLLEPGGAAGWQELVFSHVRRFNMKISLRTPEHKLIYTLDTGANAFGRKIVPGFELYDLRVDPGEWHDVFDPQTPIARELVERLRTLAGAAPAAEPAEGPELSEQERARLRSLGYAR